jgi:hypothetical protein
MRTTIFRSSCLVLFAGAMLAPALLSSQATTATRTHEVRRGETLFRIAADSLGDGNRWREIVALNPTLQSTSLRVGQKIVLPPAGALRTPSPRPTTPTTPPPAAVTPAQEPAPAPRAAPERTIFHGAKPAGGFAPPDTTRRAAAADSAIPARHFEAMSAPFVTDVFAFARGGRCVGVGEDRLAEARGVLLNGNLSVLFPAGTTGQPGSRWLLVRRGPSIPGLGIVGIPTGVARLTSAGTPISPGEAEVVAQFDAISCADAVLPLATIPRLPAVKPVAVADGARGRVAWVESESLLPTLQHAMIVDIGLVAGVRPGDRVTIYAEDGSAVAKANVVRVDQRSATVRLVSQALGSLVAGLTVRITEKLP